tara:strand:- start:561 stop:749 length:189 start_codon:yes stop_codon:yes gene_type:complete
MLSPYALTVKGKEKIDNAKRNIDAGVASLIRVSLSINLKIADLDLARLKSVGGNVGGIETKY